MGVKTRFISGPAYPLHLQRLLLCETSPVPLFACGLIPEQQIKFAFRRLLVGTILTSELHLRVGGKGRWTERPDIEQSTLLVNCRGVMVVANGSGYRLSRPFLFAVFFLQKEIIGSALGRTREPATF